MRLSELLMQTVVAFHAGRVGPTTLLELTGDTIVSKLNFFSTWQLTTLVKKLNAIT